jgi:nucleoside-diphosphate-sugar epimerase
MSLLVVAPLKAEGPMRPYDVYSGQKSEAEIVRDSALEWVILRLGAVLSPDLRALPVTTDAMYFQAALPSDGRVQTVEVRDVAWAFCAAITAALPGPAHRPGRPAHRSPYWNVPGQCADLCGAIRTKLGEPVWDPGPCWLLTAQQARRGRKDPVRTRLMLYPCLG